MFTYFCICVSALLVATSTKGCRRIAFVLFGMFLMKKVAFIQVFPHFIENPWSLYYMYAAVNLGAMYCFWKLKAHFLISLLVFINICYNICTALCFEGYTSVLFYYNIKEPFPLSVMEWIMIIELIYVGKINLNASRTIGNDNNTKRKPGDWLFCLRPWGINRGVL